MQEFRSCSALHLSSNPFADVAQVLQSSSSGIYSKFLPKKLNVLCLSQHGNVGKHSHKQEKSVLPFRAMGGRKLDRKTYRRGYEGIFPCNIVNCFSYHNYHYVVAGVQCVLCVVSNSWETDIYKGCIKVKHYEQNSTVEQKFLQTNFISFVFLESVLMKTSNGMVSLVRDYLEKVKVCETCVGGRTIRALQLSCIFSCCRTLLAAHLC